MSAFRRGGRANGAAGFTLLEMIVAVAILAALVAIVPRSLVYARSVIGLSEAWTAARLVADAVLAEELSGPDLHAGTLRGTRDGRAWTAIVAPNVALSAGGAESGRVLLDVRLRVRVAGDDALEMDTLRIGTAR